MPHIQKLISAIFCPSSWSGCVNLLSSGITRKNLRSRPIGISRFSGVSLLGIVTFVQGYLMRTTPFSSSLYWSIACLKISLTQIGYFSLHLDVIERDSIQFLRKLEFMRENMSEFGVSESMNVNYCTFIVLCCTHSAIILHFLNVLTCKISK